MKNKINWFTRVPLLLLSGAALTLSACNKTENNSSNGIKTLETENADKQIKDFEKKNTPEEKARVEQAFAELDGEIKELEVRVARTTGDDKAHAEQRLDEMRKRRAELKAEYNQAKFDALVNDVKESLKLNP